MSIKNNTILRIALPLPLRRLFDYLPPTDANFAQLIPGIRVRVPFQSRQLIGMLYEVSDDSSVPISKLKRVNELLDDEPIIPKELFTLCEWASDYYHYSLGEVLFCALPVLLRQGKKINVQKIFATASIKNRQENKMQQPLILNEAQRSACEKISDAAGKFIVFLLQGVTGSGKTEVYLQVIKKIISEHQQVLVLVPEISLTPQTIARFQERFDVPIAVLHSGLTNKERCIQWHLAKYGIAKIIIGTRSAIFTPIAQLGLIIIDEEHDASFKQQDRFRYHARDLAVVRARNHHIPICLGSATPSLESLLNAKKKRYQYVSLPYRAGSAQVPQQHILDIRTSKLVDGLSTSLLEKIATHLNANNQVLLFLNRRGFAPVLFCGQCSWIATCTRCDSRLVYHKNPARLQCHHCDAKHAICQKCEQCHHTSLQLLGLGTQKLAETLAAHFPDTPIIRLDKDTTQRKGALHELLNEINECERAILLGTQMLAKGHHFPNVTLVGIIDADSGLLSADFRAAEQTGQLLTQVSGRAGRAEKIGEVIIQTRNPNHALLQVLLKNGYDSFAQQLLTEREQFILPPFAHIALFRAEAYSEEQANTFLLAIKQICERAIDCALQTFGPAHALLAKRKGLHRRHLIIKTKQRSALHAFLKKYLIEIEEIASKTSVKWMLELDPLEM